MALSRDLVTIYAASAGTGPFSALSFLALPDNRRKNVENRIVTLFKKAGKGKKLENADLSQHDPSDQKALKEVITAMQSANVIKWRSASYTGKAGSRLAQLTSLLIDEMARLYPNCEFLLYFDPEQIQSSFLKNALRKSSRNVTLEEGHAGSNPLLQCSLLMAQLASIKAGLPEEGTEDGSEEMDEQLKPSFEAAQTWPMLLEQLQLMEKYQHDWMEENGELLLLDSKMSKEQKQMMQSMLEKDPALSASRLWSSLGRTFLKKDALELLERLHENLPTEEFQTISLNRLQKDPAWFEALLEKKANPNPAPDLDAGKLKQEKEEFMDALHARNITTLEELDQTVDCALQRIAPKVAAENRKHTLRRDYYLSLSTDSDKLDLLVLPVTNRDLQESWLMPISRRVENSTTAGRLRARDQLVQAALEQNDPVVIELEQKNDFGPLLEYLEKQPEDKQVLHLSGRSFPALRRYLMQHNIFLDIHAESCLDSPLLEAAFLIHERLQDESLTLPEKTAAENSEEQTEEQPEKRKTVPYFSGDFQVSNLKREELDLLCDPSLSVGVTRKLALAFHQGLDPEKVRILKEALDGDSYQKELRLLILPYLFSNRFVRLFQESAQWLSNEELDFVTLPGISYEKARVLIDAFKQGLSLEAVSHAIARQNTLTTIQKRLDKLKKDTDKNNKDDLLNSRRQNGNDSALLIRALPGREFSRELQWKVQRALGPVQEQWSAREWIRIENDCLVKLLKIMNEA